MGNSSCTTGVLSQASLPSVPHNIPPQFSARVLLIDGSVLKFKTPIRVTKLLLAYPNHLVYLLDSLKPGLHSLSTLLPHDQLQLGRLYLLLPFKSNAATRATSGALESKKKRIARRAPLGMQERRELAGDRFHVGSAVCANDHKKGDVGLNTSDQVRPTSSALQREEVLHMISKKKEDHVGRSWQWKNRSKEVNSGGSECYAETQKNCDVGLHDRRHFAASSCSYEKLSSGKRERRVIRSTCSNDGKAAVMKERRVADSGNARDQRHALSSQLCDTPELQRAYRSLLQRSSSWTPRLQPIVERR